MVSIDPYGHMVAEVYKDLIDDINLSGDYNSDIEKSFENALVEFKKLR